MREHAMTTTAVVLAAFFSILCMGFAASQLSILPAAHAEWMSGCLYRFERLFWEHDLLEQTTWVGGLLRRPVV